jgi:hypothetical protein
VTPACGRWSSGPSGCSTGSSPTRTARPWPLAVRTLLGPLAVRPRAGIPVPTTTSAPRPCGRPCCAPSGPSATTPTCGPRRPGGSPTPAPPPAPDIESAVLDIVASDGGPAEYEAFLAHYRAPSTPQEENRYLYALASFRRPDWPADLRPGPVRGPQPERPVRAPAPGGQPGPPGRPPGSGSSPRSGTFPRQVPVQHPAPHARRRPGPVRAARAGRRGHAVHRDPPPARRGRTVEQILERLAINVAFGSARGPAGRRPWARCSACHRRRGGPEGRWGPGPAAPAVLT